MRKEPPLENNMTAKRFIEYLRRGFGGAGKIIYDHIKATHMALTGEGTEAHDEKRKTMNGHDLKDAIDHAAQIVLCTVTDTEAPAQESSTDPYTFVNTSGVAYCSEPYPWKNSERNTREMMKTDDVVPGPDHNTLNIIKENHDVFLWRDRCHHRSHYLYLFAPDVIYSEAPLPRKYADTCMVNYQMARGNPISSVQNRHSTIMPLVPLTKAVLSRVCDSLGVKLMKKAAKLHKKVGPQKDMHRTQEEPSNDPKHNVKEADMPDKESSGIHHLVTVTYVAAQLTRTVPFFDKPEYSSARKSLYDHIIATQREDTDMGIRALDNQRTTVNGNSLKKAINQAGQIVLCAEASAEGVAEESRVPHTFQDTNVTYYIATDENMPDPHRHNTLNFADLGGNDVFVWRDKCYRGTHYLYLFGITGGHANWCQLTYKLARGNPITSVQNRLTTIMPLESLTKDHLRRVCDK